VGPNPTQGLDVWCVYGFILCLCVLCLGRGFATSWSPVQGVLLYENNPETERSAQCLKVGARGRKKSRVQTSSARNMRLCFRILLETCTYLCMSAFFCVCLFLYRRCLPTGLSPAQRILTNPYKQNFEHRTSLFCRTSQEE
jgi:hypothetical protein